MKIKNLLEKRSKKKSKELEQKKEKNVNSFKSEWEAIGRDWEQVGKDFEKVLFGDEK